MICRRNQHGLVLIPQEEAARIAGQLARQLGGEIEKPANIEAMVRAAAMSQRGWAEFDDFLAVDARGLPAEAEDAPRLEQIAAWEQTTRLAWEETEQAEWVWAGQAAGGSVIPLEADTCARRAASFLSILALQWLAHPALHRGESRRENFAFNQLQHLELERLEKVRELLGLREDVPTRHGLPEAGADLPYAQLTRAERELVREVRLLEVVLETAREACGHTVVQRPLGVAARRWEAPETLVRCQWRKDERLVMSPWLFESEGMTLEFSARCVAPRRYRDAADLRQAVAAASEMRLSVELAKDG